LAVADAKKACELGNWELGSHIDTLAAAYAEAGGFTSAVRYQEQAIGIYQSVPEKFSRTMAKLRYNEHLYQRITDRAAEEVRNC
jgi:hypothetical protein